MKLRKMLSLLMAGCVGLAGLPITQELVDATTISVSAATETSGTCGDNVTWTLDEESGTLTISGTGKMFDYKSHTSPFDRDLRIKAVIIENGVSSIGNSAFENCSSLTSITIPNSVTCIGSITFEFCTSLTSISIPDSVTTIGDSAFCFCDSLASITIPDSVTSIGDAAFANCNNLTSITIPNGVTSIRYGTFAGCKSLTSIKIPDSVTSICEHAFVRCTNLTSIKIPDSVTLIREAFSCCKKLTSIKIPNGVTSIDSCTFEYCTSLTSIKIPDSVTSIGNSAFNDCASLTDVYYAGSEDDWNKIKIRDFNYALKNATIHFNSTGPSVVPENYTECFPKPYKIIALKSNVNGKYLTCDVGAQQSNGKYDMNNSKIKAEADKIQAYEEFELVPCYDDHYAKRHYAIRSRFNRKYLSYNSFEGVKFKADFIRADERLELETQGSDCRIRFVNADKYLYVSDDNKVDVTKDDVGTWFQLETVSENRYSPEDKAALSSNEWFNIDNKGVGYWNIQDDIGKNKSDLLSEENVKSLLTLGYTALGRKDKLALTVEYDNMQCAVGAKKKDDGTYDVIIAFQGTGGYSDEDWFDAFRDATSNLTSSVNGCGMHEGYYKMAMKLGDHEDDVAIGEFNAYVNGIEERYSLSDLLTMAKNGKAHITLLGHSMGGAIAQCYALHLVTDRGIKPKNITGRTFNSALAVTEDITVGWDDWVNLCVSTDSVPNGLVPGSIYEYGVHRIGRTIWLYDPLPDLNTDTIKALDVIETNIAKDKHEMGQTLYTLLSGIKNDRMEYFINFVGNISKGYDRISNDPYENLLSGKLTKVVAFDFDKSTSLLVTNASKSMLSVMDGAIQKIDDSIKATISDDKIYVELPADADYTLEVTSDSNSAPEIGVASGTVGQGINSVSIYEVPENSNSYTIALHANEDAANITGTDGNKLAPVKTWLLGDVNEDGSTDVKDVVLLQKWLLADPYTQLSDWKAADCYADDRLNAVDLCMMKRMLLHKGIA